MTIMTQDNLFRSLVRWFKSGPARKPRTQRSRAGWRVALGVERFEDRTVPATLNALDPLVTDSTVQELDSISSVEKVGAISPTPRSPVLQQGDLMGPGQEAVQQEAIALDVNAGPGGGPRVAADVQELDSISSVEKIDVEKIDATGGRGGT
jgi:hypothetical protein